METLTNKEDFFFLGPPHFTNIKNLTDKTTVTNVSVTPAQPQHFCFVFSMHASAICASLVREGHDCLNKIGCLFFPIWQTSLFVFYFQENLKGDWYFFTVHSAHTGVDIRWIKKKNKKLLKVIDDQN